MSGDKLPFDMVDAIFLRLPFKSIARFRYLSKFMHAHLTNSKFITRYINFTEQSDKSDPIAIACDGLKLLSVAFPKAGGNPKVIHHPPYSMRAYNIRVIGSCMSLVCLCDEESLYLWNREEGKVKTIEIPGKPWEAESNSYGFGFHNSEKDYQIVRVYTTAESHGQSYLSVYSVTANSWMRAESIFYQVSKIAGKFCYGNVHWPADCEGLGWADTLIAFNLRKRKCQILPLPGTGTWSDVTVCGVGTLHRRLNVMLCHEMELNEIKVWIMMEYGKKESWQCIFRISGLSLAPAVQWLHAVPLFYINRDMELIFCDKSGFFVLDTKDGHQELRRIVIPGLAECNLEGISESEYLPNEEDETPSANCSAVENPRSDKKASLRKK